ncbi:MULTISPECIES: alpha/beta hydrolase [Actinomadura]|uniref:Alpha/beta hydrolase n=1 Tax=Actinomadura miaoliensis TaxID=430685 RepID=A0ABP7WQG9_9ACTN
MTATQEPAPAQVGPPPPFDPELSAALDMVREQLPRLSTLESIPEVRQGRVGTVPPVTDDDLRLDGAFEVEERAVPGPPGAPDVSLLICRPVGVEAPYPAIYHIHGGGMILGDNRTGLPDMLLPWARELGTAVVSVEYRLAPEHPHPAPVEDCYAGLVWTHEHAAELGVDPERIIVAGASAGGGLSAGVALMARDRGGPPLLAQMLLCPMLDDRNDSPSVLQMEGLDIWDRTANHVGWTALLGDARGGPDVSPYAAPARAVDLSGLPPAFIDVGSAESFRDEDVAYAVRLWQAGGRAELHVWPGGYHAFDGFAPQAPVSREARDARLRWLRRVLNG